MKIGDYVYYQYPDGSKEIFRIETIFESGLDFIISNKGINRRVGFSRLLVEISQIWLVFK